MPDAEMSLPQPDRRMAYYTLCSHYRRWLALSVRTELGFAVRRSDEELAKIKPKTWRAIAKRLIDDADQADRECMAAWSVPADKLDEFVRVRTHPELEKLMLKQYGLVWNSHFQNWESK